jgi:FKBP-type peptidyl-prolyl cis-trans isomerase FkpA
MLKKLLSGIIVIGVLSVMSGCLKSSTVQADPCAYDTCAFKAPATEIQAVQNYLTANNITATQHCSGLFYRIDVPGTGATPDVCSTVTVTYEGKLTDGTVFNTATTPVSFSLSQVIPGWRNGLPKVNAGGRIYLYIPPSLGYGATQAGSIPPNSILVFRIELIAVQ